MVETSLDDDKALDVVVIDLVGKTTVADHLIIASGTSRRHVGAMIDRLREKLKAASIVRPSVEGMENRDWVVIDAGDVIVHLFRPEARSFYNLEKLWSLPGPGAAAADGSGSQPAA